MDFTVNRSAVLRLRSGEGDILCLCHLLSAEFLIKSLPLRLGCIRVRKIMRKYQVLAARFGVLTLIPLIFVYSSFSRNVNHLYKSNTFATVSPVSELPLQMQHWEVVIKNQHFRKKLILVFIYNLYLY